MLKKVITITIALCLIFSISVMAENAQGNENIPNTSSERPMRGDFDPSKMPQGDFDPSKMPEGFTPPNGKFTPSQNTGEFTPPESSKNNAEAVTPPANENVTTENQQTQENGEESNRTQGGNQQFGGQMLGGMGGFPGNMQSFNGQTQEDAPKGFLGFVKTYSTPITSVVLLGLAFIFVIFYRRKNY